VPEVFTDDMTERRQRLFDRRHPAMDAATVDDRLTNALGPLRDFIEAYVSDRGYPRDVAWTSADRFCASVRTSFNLLRLCAESLDPPRPSRG